MAKVFIYPTNSLILADLVERYGHDPLAIAQEIRKKIQTPSIDSPPLNMTSEDPKIGLKYAAVDVPSGVRGRMALYDPLLEAAEAAILVKNTPVAFGCIGCARTNELVNFLIRNKGIPYLDLEYPKNEEEAKTFIKAIRDFLNSLETKKEEEEVKGEENVQ